MSFEPSKYQAKVYDFITDDEGNAVINAVAGSGKTTTLIEALKKIPSSASVQFLAFNKSIKGEIQQRVNDIGVTNTTVNTCHGFGYLTILNSLEHAPEIDNLKYRKLLRAIFNYVSTEDSEHIDPYKIKGDDMGLVWSFDVDWEEVDNKLEFSRRILQLANLGRMNLTTDVQNLESIAEKYNISLFNDEAKLASNLVKLADKFLDTIDFTDMIYLPNKMNMSCQKFDWVFIDECQDLNAAQRELMLKSMHPNSRFIAVGDRNQAIYGFAGADADSFDKLTELPNTKVLPLSVCYRCGSDIIKQAQNIVPQIEAFEKNGKGYVNFDGKIADIKDGDMVLCRNTYPLVKMCLGFLKAGIKATIMGGDIGKSLINMVKDTNQKEMDKVFDGLYHTLDTTLKRIMRADNCTAEDAREHIEYVNAEEKIQVIEAIYEAGDTAETVIKKLERIFNDVTKDGIILSTIHKSKGLEAERVFIIHPERMPSKFATQEWELVQEDNLRYVAYTRAKNLLSFVRDFDAYKGRELESFADKVKEVKESNHVGEVGCRYALKGTITECRYIPNYDAMVYVIEDKEGNIYEKWGDIHRKYITSETKELKEGVEIKASVMISKHTEFRGVKKNTIKNLGVYR